jgi:hypothetical protein
MPDIYGFNRIFDLINQALTGKGRKLEWRKFSRLGVEGQKKRMYRGGQAKKNRLTAV